MDFPRQLIRTDQVPTTLSFNDLLPPDSQVLLYPEFTIDQARSLRDWLGLRSENSKWVAIVIDQSSIEAEQSMLKIIEESEIGILLVVPAGMLLLPTISSRFVEIDWPGAGAGKKEYVEEWRQSTLADRLDFITNWKKTGTLAGARVLVRQLVESSNNHKEKKAGMQALDYLQTGTVPSAMVLEWLAISTAPN